MNLTPLIPVANYSHQLCFYQRTEALMTPGDADGISRVMQSVGRGYGRYVNKHYRRSIIGQAISIMA